MNRRFKRALYDHGPLRRYLRWRGRNALTVAMFHRVLPHDDPRAAGADPEWTVSPKFFRQCLDFFRTHFTLIDLDQLRHHSQHGQPLPPNSLLVTFDDGWQDNHQYALPILREAGLSALFFVVSNTVGQRQPFWQEHIYACWATGRLLPEFVMHCMRLFPLDHHPNQALDQKMLRCLVRGLSGLGEEERQRLMQGLPWGGDTPAMLSRAELRALAAADMSIGSHGQTHTPLTLAPHPSAELRDSQAQLADLLDMPRHVIDSLSFPHGAVNSDLLERARSAGYTFLFTSEHCINAPSRVARGTLGRIHLSQPALADANGDLMEDRLAWLLARTPVSSSPTLYS